MRTNADVTLYNKYIDTATRSEVYQRAQIQSVAWENRKASNRLASGGDIKADQAYVYIPKARGTEYLAVRDWQALPVKTGYWTLQTGDVIVRGLIDAEIGASYTLSDLKREYNDVLTISSIDLLDNGSFALQHWKVGAG